MENCWTCPECATSNTLSLRKCSNCSCFASKSTELRKDDWICTQCQESNFRKRSQCRKCFACKPSIRAIPIQTIPSTVTELKPKLLSKVGGYVCIKNNSIMISSYTDYKDNNSYIRSIIIGGYNSKEETINYIYEEMQQYPEHRLIIDNYMVHIDEDLPLVRLFIQKFGDSLYFTNCSLVGKQSCGYFGKRPKYLREFTKEWFEGYERGESIDYVIGGGEFVNKNVLQHNGIF